VLTAADGNPFSAYDARPARSDGSAVVLLPDAHGLSPFYRQLALRFAESGIRTLVVDPFGRTAGTGPRDASFDFEPHLAQLHRAEMLLDSRAAVDHLAEVDRVFIAGFCMGGGVALLAGTTDLDLAGVIGFYAWTGSLGRDGALPTDFVAAIRCPVLGLFGGADQVIDTAVPRAFDEYLHRAGVPHEIVIYPGQPHGFFELHDLGRDGHAEAATDAFGKLLAFVGG
jgi:carboxymethylenebutenolidase